MKKESDALTAKPSLKVILEQIDINGTNLWEHGNESFFGADESDPKYTIARELELINNLDDDELVTFVSSLSMDERFWSVTHFIEHLLGERINLLVSSNSHEAQQLLACSNYITAESINKIIEQGNEKVIVRLSRNDGLDSEMISSMLKINNPLVNSNLLNHSGLDRNTIMDFALNSDDYLVRTKAFRRVTEKEILFMILKAVSK